MSHKSMLAARTANPMMSEEDFPHKAHKGETPFQKRCNKVGAVAMLTIMSVIIFAAIGYDVPENRFDSTDSGSQDPPLQNQRTVFVHLFEWKWTDIEKECVNFLGPKGFSAVQVSPVQEHVDHTKVSQVDLTVQPDFMPWWARYQPVSYKLESRSGTREELISMIETCQSVGVDIYVDILFNHMAATNTGFGNAGTAFNSTSLEYEMYDASHFNTCEPDSIQDDDWANNAERVRRCRLVGLPDLNHDIPYVKETLIAHAQDLMDIGVRGLRLDAGKHMYVDDVNDFLNGLTGVEPYVFSEIIDYGSEAISVLEYTPYYAITEFRYEGTINDRFKRSSLQNLVNLEEFGFVPRDKAVVFTDNHDSQRHSGHLTFKDGVLYSLANIFMLAHPYGYPKLMSSFFFEEGQKDRGPPSDRFGNTNSVYNSDGSDNCDRNGQEWICEHRNNKVANMVGFRNHVTTVGATELTNFWTNGFQAIAFAREGSNGVAGFVVINKEDFPITETWFTGLPAGEYCDVISGDKGEGQSCEGRLVTVDESGNLETTVAAFDALAIYGTPN